MSAYPHLRQGWSIATAAMLAAWPAFSGGGAAGGQQPLAVEGRAAAVVVLPDTALPRGVESVAARVLVDHLRQMSGARL